MAEIDALRAQTKAFIDADSVAILLIEVQLTSDGKGGKKRSWPIANARDPQVFRLIPRSSTNDRVHQVNTSDGKLANVEFVLMGEHDSVMGKFDRFSFNAQTFEVAEVHQTTSAYQIKGDVVRVG